MKFPKVASVDLSQFPTDSSELTPQENYIFNTIFQPEINAYNEMRMQNQSNNQSLRQQPNSQDPSNPHAKQSQQQLKDHQGKKISKNMPIKTRLLLSLMFVILIVVFSLTPIPNSIGNMLKNSPIYFAMIVLVLFLFAFMILTKYIKI